jgi:hypothetical protein
MGGAFSHGAACPSEEVDLLIGPEIAMFKLETHSATVLSKESCKQAP